MTTIDPPPPRPPTPPDRPPPPPEVTRAEHARQGFFQLLWVAGLALSMLGSYGFLGANQPELQADDVLGALCEVRV